MKHFLMCRNGRFSFHRIEYTIKFLFIVFLIQILGFVSTVNALSLSEAVDRYIKNSEEISAAELERQEVFYRYKEAKSSFFPSLNLKAGYNSQKSVFYLGSQIFNSDTSLYSTSLEVSQPLYLGGKIWSAFKIREIQKELSQFKMKDKKNRAIESFLDVASQWMSLKEQLAELENSLKVQKQLVAITKKKKSRGAVNPYEWDQVQADYDAFVFRVEQRGLMFKSIDRQLRQMLALSENEKLDMQWADFKGPIVGSDRASLIEKAKTQRPDWKMGEAGVELSKAEQRLELGDDKPSVALFGSYGYQGTDASQIGDPEAQVHSYGINLTVPLFSGLSSVHKRRAGTAKVFSTEKRKELLEKNIRTDISNKLEAYKSSYTQLALAKDWAEKSKNALNKAIQSFRIGRLTMTQMSQLQAANERAAGAFAEAKRAFFLAERDWNLSLGKDLEEYYTNPAN